MAGFAISPSTNALRAGGGSVVVNADGSVSITPASGTGVLLGVAPPATANRALMQIGNGPIDGSIGHYVGSANGGGYGANFASGYVGDLANLQIAGTSKFRIDQFGNLFMVQGQVILAGSSPSLQFNATGIVAGPSGNGPSSIPLATRGVALQTADLIQAQDSGSHPQWGVANVGSGASPIWALRVRAVANAESMVQLHTAGAATGRAIQIIDDAGTSLGWLNLTS